MTHPLYIYIGCGIFNNSGYINCSMAIFYRIIHLGVTLIILINLITFNIKQDTECLNIMTVCCIIFDVIFAFNSCNWKNNCNKLTLFA